MKKTSGSRRESCFILNHLVRQVLKSVCVCVFEMDKDQVRERFDWRFDKFQENSSRLKEIHITVKNTLDGGGYFGFKKSLLASFSLSVWDIRRQHMFSIHFLRIHLKGKTESNLLEISTRFQSC